MPLVELRALVDQLPDYTGPRLAFARPAFRDGMKYAPLPQALQRIVMGERALVPELQEPAGAGIDPTTAQVFPPRASGTLLGGRHLDRSAPRAPMVVRISIVGCVDGVGARPPLLDRHHVS